MHTFFRIGLALVIWLVAHESVARDNAQTVERLSVVLIPADGGTADGTLADFSPLFSALEKTTRFEFELTVGQNYSAVIEGMCSGLADIAWFGPSSYAIARDRGCAELLAIEIANGNATYRSALFKRANSDLQSISDLKSRSVATGSVHSTSSFLYPMAMIMAAGVDPISDLGEIQITGNHANSLRALQIGAVDIAGASLNSYMKAVNQRAIDAEDIVILAASDPIPNPPFAIRPDVPAEVKQKLRDALSVVHQAPGVKAEMIRGYGGRVVDRFDTTLTDEQIDKALLPMLSVNGSLKEAILQKAGRKTHQ